jgi:uncharacterized protein (TIGR03435 family)
MVRMIALCLAVLAVAAQTPGFEVALMKLVNPPAGPHVVSLIINHGNLNIEAAELRQMIGLAYAIQRVRVLGGPDWADADQFDVAAKSGNPDATRDDLRGMLQLLLAERFKLAVHRETREIAAYSVVLGKKGSKLKESAPDRKSSMADTVSPAGTRQTVFEATPLRVLVNMLANTLGSPVVDQTGLAGLYDFTFEWPDAGTSLSAALEELGLKLEAKKTAVEVLVIDRADKLSAN